MASVVFGLIALLIIISTINTVSSIQCELQIEAFKPKGFRVMTADQPGATRFKFGARINRDRQLYRGGDDVSYEVTEPMNGKWIIMDKNLALRASAYVDFRAVLTVNGTECVAHRTSFVVTELHEQPADWKTGEEGLQSGPKHSCASTDTEIWGAVACSGDLIFEDNFNNIREDIWRVEGYYPFTHPEYPFVSYQNQAVTIENGTLKITPKPLQEYPGYQNNENILSRTHEIYQCTARHNECSFKPSGYQIVPPVVSGRINSIGFAFKYGVVTVRAKMPIGDWLYPEILLEPLLQKYGTDSYVSGNIKIACARGNEWLKKDYTDLSNKQLYGGPIIDRECRELLLRTYNKDNKPWGDDFHVYTLKWTPSYIALSVDDVEWMKIESPFYSSFPQTCKDKLPMQNYISSGQSAPFDQLFYLSFGVAVGGITDFPDGVWTEKPWRNNDIKAMLNFWRDQSSWYPTWTQPLLIDYVKVYAL